MTTPTNLDKSINIDFESRRVVVVSEDGRSKAFKFDTAEAFNAISRAWIRCGWETKYTYGFTWLGRPIIQLPEDMVRLQEVIFTVQPDVVIETGVAHGGSLIFYASLFKALGRGRVVGIDIEIRPHNRAAIEAHQLFPFITLIEGSSIDPGVISEVKMQVKPGEKTLITLDSCHTKEHVLAELSAYAPIVSLGSYIVVMDGVMEDLVGAPRSQPDWTWNNPRQAALEFVESHPDFIIEEPPFLFNEGDIHERVTYWPSAFLKRIS
jgi:cephalosporin hydroxylase